MKGRCWSLLFIIFSILSITLLGCQKKIDVPKKEHMMLITYLKEPSVSFYDIQSEMILKNEKLDFVIQTMEKLSDELLLFTKYKEDGLFILNLHTGKVVKVANVGKGITTMLSSPELNLCFLADTKRNKVYFFDMKKKQITSSVDVEDSPASFALNAKDKELFVATLNHASISKISIGNQKVISSFNIIERPSSLFFDGKDIWVAAHGPFDQLNDHLYVYDADTGKNVKKIKVGSMPVKFYQGKSDKFLYVICHGSNEVYKINIKNGIVDTPLEVSENPNFITGSKDEIYVTNLDGNSLSVIDQKSFQLKKQIQLNNGPYMMYLR